MRRGAAWHIQVDDILALIPRLIFPFVFVP